MSLTVDEVVHSIPVFEIHLQQGIHLRFDVFDLRFEIEGKHGCPFRERERERGVREDQRERERERRQLTVLSTLTILEARLCFDS